MSEAERVFRGAVELQHLTSLRRKCADDTDAPENSPPSCCSKPKVAPEVEPGGTQPELGDR